MKKVFSSLAILAILFTAVACGGNSNPAGNLGGNKTFVYTIGSTNDFTSDTITLKLENAKFSFDDSALTAATVNLAIRNLLSRDDNSAAKKLSADDTSSNISFALASDYTYTKGSNEIKVVAKISNSISKNFIYKYNVVIPKESYTKSNGDAATEDLTLTDTIEFKVTGQKVTVNTTADTLANLTNTTPSDGTEKTEVVADSSSGKTNTLITTFTIAEGATVDTTKTVTCSYSNTTSLTTKNITCTPSYEDGTLSLTFAGSITEPTTTDAGSITADLSKIIIADTNYALDTSVSLTSVKIGEYSFTK